MDSFISKEKKKLPKDLYKKLLGKRSLKKKIVKRRIKDKVINPSPRIIETRKHRLTEPWNS
jgi:hypothetical protein